MPVTLPNLYSFIPILIISITSLIVLLYSVFKNKNILVSKDGISISSKDGKFLNVNHVKKIIDEGLPLVLENNDIIKNKIINDQKDYSKRELVLMFSDITDVIREKNKLEKDNTIFKNIEFVINNYVFNEILKEFYSYLFKNHLLEKKNNDWKTYREMNKKTIIDLFYKKIDYLFKFEQITKDELNIITCVSEFIEKKIDDHIDNMFDNVKDIAFNYEKRKTEIKIILDDLKSVYETKY